MTASDIFATLYPAIEGLLAVGLLRALYSLHQTGTQILQGKTAAAAATTQIKPPTASLCCPVHEQW